MITLSSSPMMTQNVREIIIIRPGDNIIIQPDVTHVDVIIWLDDYIDVIIWQYYDIWDYHLARYNIL